MNKITKRHIQPLILPIVLGILLNICHVTHTIERQAETELPVRYDETQLWRIHNISQAVEDQEKQMTLPTLLENKFEANIWNDNAKFLDISIDSKHVTAAKSFLKSYNLVPEVLNSNIQYLFDEEAAEVNKSSQANVQERSSRATASGMNWQQYHDLSTIYAYLHEVAAQYPNLCSLFNIGHTIRGRNLWVLRISENLNNKKIWIDGGIHAREWISPASVTFIINRLLSNWAAQPLYIRQKTWFLMPVMNPDGYVYSRDVDRLWRKNRAPNAGSTCVGVDLNRNFDTGWSAGGSSTNPCSEVYRGPYAASELETRAVKKFLIDRKFNLSAYLTYHSYSQVMVYPWAYKAATVNNAAELKRVGQLAAQRIQTKTGRMYDTAITYQYFGITGGGSDDWSRAALGAEYVYTMELRDKGQYGFVLPPDQIIGTGEEAFIFASTVAQAI